MSVQPQSSSNDRERAAEAVKEARETISEMADRELPNARMVILEALARAERAVALSECRKAKPFAEIVQIGDDSGLYYQCTHTPPHRY